MECSLLSKSDYSEWDRFVEKSPQGSIYSRPFYLDALEASYEIAVVRDSGEIRAGIVLARDELKSAGNPLFVKYLGPLFAASDGKYANRLTSERKLLEAMQPFLKSYRTFDYSFHSQVTDWLPFYWEGYRQETRYTYILPDLSDMQSLRKEYRKHIRQDIRRAERAGISIIDDISCDDFYAVNRLSFDRQGAPPPYSLERVKKIFSALSERNAMKLFAARDEEGTVHAVAGVVYDANSCNLLLNGVNHHLKDCGANSMLVDKTVEFASSESQRYDFEGSMLKPVERFYRAFGAELTPFFRVWRPSLMTSAKHTAIRWYKKLRYGK